MIQEKQQLQVTGSLDGEKVRMSIDDEAMAHIMSVLTDLYSDTEMAVLREISTNAFDAHVEAGVQRPIEVTLPSGLNPFLRIRDFGVGLTVEDIRDVYSKYGASTKRGTNDQTGMLGLGCKSPLTYANQFTITSCKDGTKIAVAISRDEDGAGSMTVLPAEDCTDEGDGTEVTIPVKRDQSFTLKALELFRFWPEGSVLVNGEEIPRIEGLKIKDGMLLIEGPPVRYGAQNNPGSYVVMGNVPYPWDEDFTPQGTGLIAFVPIGSVAFAPNREGLRDNRLTKDTLARLQAEYGQAVPDAVQREVDKCAAPSEAVATVVKWSRYLPRGTSFTYKGEDLPTGIEAPHGTSLLVSRAKDRYNLASTSQVRELGIGSWPRVVWVSDYTVNHTAQHKRKMLKWCEANGIDDVETFCMLPGKAPESKFIDPKRRVAWETVRAVVLDGSGIAADGTRYKAYRIPGSFDVYENSILAHGKPAADIDQAKPVFWKHGNKWNSGRMATILAEHYPDSTLVILPANRIDKFKRDFPNAIEGSEGIDRAYKKWLTKITEAQKHSMAIFDSGYGLRDRLRALRADRIDDPELRQAIEYAMVDVTKLINQRSAFGTRSFGPGVTFNNPLDKYPLSACIRQIHQTKLVQEHVYLYLNAAYAARQED